MRGRIFAVASVAALSLASATAEADFKVWTPDVNQGELAVSVALKFTANPVLLAILADWQDQDNRGGPQLFGKIFNLGPGTLEWNGGIPIGMTKAVPIVTPRWQLEDEIHY
jgi:hypothetical protein